MNNNVTIFLDESGNLGFDWSKAGTSEYFIITILVCWDTKILSSFKKAVQRTLKNKINKKSKNSLNELKGSKLALENKQYFFRSCPKENWELYSYILVKKNVYQHLKTSEGRSKLYNFLARKLIEQVPFGTQIKSVNLVIDKSKNTSEIKDFNNYLKWNIEGSLPLNTSFNISHLKSHESYGIQAVDLFSWGIFRKYAHKDSLWYQEYKNFIKFEKKFLNN